jgi:hypothetical protein
MTAAKSKQPGTTRARAKSRADTSLTHGTDSNAPALTSIESALVLARLQVHTLAEAAKAAGISWSTAWRHWQRPEVQAAYRAASSEVYRDGLRTVQGLVGKAALQLERDLRSNRPAIRMQAMRLVFSVGHRAADQLDISSRLDALEGTK